MYHPPWFGGCRRRRPAEDWKAKFGEDMSANAALHVEKSHVVGCSLANRHVFDPGLVSSISGRTVRPLHAITSDRK